MFRRTTLALHMFGTRIMMSLATIAPRGEIGGNLPDF